ncbi:DUF4013 domain-containing protein [Halobaculum sp. P14]|uniref:DUF4013 domain-containing protein n=1 Tax=Halobaculum sp. P14 TaxID=3421638 RepID=UPI003EB7BC1A
MFEDAVKFPLESEDRVSTLIIGGVLTLLSVLIIPAFIVQGYLIRVLRAAATGEEAAPSFTDWGDLFVDGLKLLVINLVYGIAIMVPFVLVGVVGIGGAAFTEGFGGVAALSAVTVLLFALVALVALVISYVIPAALTNFALDGSLSAAFDVDTIKQVALTGDYFVGVLLGVVLGGVIGTIASPLVFLLVGIPLLFYGQVVTYYCFGRGFADARGGAGAGAAGGPVADAQRDAY